MFCRTSCNVSHPPKGILVAPKKQPPVVRASKIAAPVLDVLSRCVTKSNTATLPPGQLDRPLYVAVNAVLESLGGTWNRKAKAHVFANDLDVGGLLEAVVITGEYVSHKDILKAFNFFRSPPPVVSAIVDRLGLFEGARVLEPSAGDGAIADGVKAACPSATIDVVEVQVKLREKLFAKEYRLIGADFLGMKVEQAEFAYDRVAMNPPFRGQADIAHVMHAITFLRPAGRTVAVMSKGVQFRMDGVATSFRRLLDVLNATVEPLPENAFHESGTEAQTVLVTINKPHDAWVGEILPR